MTLIVQQLLQMKVQGRCLTEYEAQLLEASARLLATRYKLREAVLQTHLIEAERDLDELREGRD